MTATASPNLKDLFIRALDMAPADADAFVDSVVANDTALGCALRDLLAAHRSSWAASSLGRASTSAPERPAEPPDASREGFRIIGRYRMGSILGAGAFGRVHRAIDEVTGESVAVKIVPHRPGPDWTRARRWETAVLRRARLPGLAELLDDGEESDFTFLVMRLVDGTPFPGRDIDVPAAWDAIAPRARSILLALGRLHWLGILHRDVKPANVLVDGAGTATLVDFGVALDDDEAAAERTDLLWGTLGYLAPERLAGRPATRASDLYAVGVMLWEALTGRTLHACASTLDLIRLRTTTPAPSLASDPAVAGRVPAHVVEAIDAMLSIDPAARPASAREALARLDGDPTGGAQIALPWIGDDSAVRAVVDAVKSGRSVEVTGPPGIGKTRTIEEAAKRLRAEGWTVEREGARATFVDPCLVGAQVTVVESRAHGPHSIGVAPRGESELRALFRGPNRLFHLQDDGARELYRRTLGIPGEMQRVLRSWIDGGLAQWEGGLVVVDRSGLDRLEAGVALTLPAAESALPAGRLAERLQGLLEVAATELPVDRLGEWTGATPDAVASTLREIESAGLCRINGDRVAATRDAGISAAWPVEQVVHAHARIAAALPEGSEARAYHSRAGCAPDAASDELAAAQALMEVGRHGRAAAILSGLLRHERRRPKPDPAVVRSAMSRLLDTALAEGTVAALLEAGEAIRRFDDASPEYARHGALCRAAVQSLRAAPEAALATLDAAPPALDEDDERREFSVRAFAARQLPDRSIERRVGALAAVASRRKRHRSVRSVAWEIMGWAAYRRGRFRCATARHRRAARWAQTATRRASCALNGASAAMESGDMDSAAALGALARRELEALRVPNAHARLAWIDRSVEYRLGHDCTPDLELAAAASSHIPRHLAGLIHLTEGAIAWRCGEYPLAMQLLGRAHRMLLDARRHAIAALASSLAAAIERTSESEPDPSVLCDAPPGIAAQIVELRRRAAGIGGGSACPSRGLIAGLRAEVLEPAEIRSTSMG